MSAPPALAIASSSEARPSSPNNKPRKPQRITGKTALYAVSALGVFCVAKVVLATDDGPAPEPVVSCTCVHIKGTVSYNQ